MDADDWWRHCNGRKMIEWYALVTARTELNYGGIFLKRIDFCGKLRL